MYCEHCGAWTPDYSRFCEQCGQPVTNRGTLVPASSATHHPFPVRTPHTKKRRPQPPTAPQYHRIALWIRMRCGNRLSPGMNAVQVRQELEQIFQSERARGIPEEFLVGFRGYIEQQRYDMLLR